jgi:TonB family protein
MITDFPILKTKNMKLFQPKLKNCVSAKYTFIMSLSLMMFVLCTISKGQQQTNDKPSAPKAAKSYDLDTIEVIGYGHETSNSKNEVFTSPEDMPEYPGGTQEMYRFINQNVKYPDAAKKSGVEGTVFVKFIVKNDGKVGDVTVVKGIGFGADEEAIRIVKNMPVWKPGKQNGKPVDAYFNMPIRFLLSPNNNSVSLKNSLDSETSPLIIAIDENGDEKEVMDMKSISADNILKMEVLKNEHATHAYGEKGKNGVVRITLDKK